MQSKYSDCIPVLYTRGSHYQVGHDVGRTFSGLIQGLMTASHSLNQVYIPMYETPEGQSIYQQTLSEVTQHFPQYVDELQGIANGAQVPFYKLFLLHMEEVLHSPDPIEDKGTGCSTVWCTELGQEMLGHNEDAFPEARDRIYLVDAHIVSDNYQEEHFTSLCYAGYLPGFTMGYNQYGLIFSVNSLRPKDPRPGNIPCCFYARALMVASNLEHAKKLLQPRGHARSGGLSINMYFLGQESEKPFLNAELGPGLTQDRTLNIEGDEHGKHSFHCNKYLRLPVKEAILSPSTEHRYATIASKGRPRNMMELVDILSDQSDQQFPIYREGEVCTVAVGVFDLVARTWSIYTNNPKNNAPVIIMPLQTNIISS